ncbi:MAG: hypothetical protein D6694_07035 [Gammaproteobacteria bacterium]|nr:MAG: hypothetical protein D6694_07035 [Gammaproteobacteria bacterium]
MSQDKGNIQSASFSEPCLVQIFHDGVELVRVVDGCIELNEPVSGIPEILEIHWDKRVVYRLERGTPVINLMVAEMERISSVSPVAV